MTTENTTEETKSTASKMLPEYTIVVGGKPRKLVYNIYAFIRLEEETGLSVIDGGAFQAKKLSHIVALLWAGLLTHWPEATIEEVAKTVDIEEIMSLPEQVQKGLERGMPTAPDKKKSQSVDEAQQTQTEDAST